MRHDLMNTARSALGSFYCFSQVRFAGRYYRAQTPVLSGRNR